jgi:hypothetical protein
MNVWDTQQTAETIRSNIEARFNSFSSDEQMKKNEAEYKAEKVRRYKLSLIRKWREKK